LTQQRKTTHIKREFTIGREVKSDLADGLQIVAKHLSLPTRIGSERTVKHPITGENMRVRSITVTTSSSDLNALEQAAKSVARHARRHQGKKPGN
jgi:hypothetical protein